MTDTANEIAALRAQLAIAERATDWWKCEAKAARSDEMQALRDAQALRKDLTDAQDAAKHIAANARMFAVAEVAKFLHGQLLDDHLRPLPAEHTRVSRGHRADARKALTEAWRALERAICANSPGVGA